MSRQHRTPQETLARIAELAQHAIDDGGSDPEPRGPVGRGRDELPEVGEEGTPTCTPRLLPDRLQLRGAEIARRHNPANAPLLAAVGGIFGDTPLDPLRIAVLTSKYWGPAQRRLTVSFMDSTDTALRNRILSHMNAWSQRCGISFVYTAGTGQVRISRGGGGYWSYLGTDILLIPRNRPTMNLEGFTMSTPEREYKRVVRHETGHTLGAPHEHMRRALVARIDRERAYAYFWRTQRWDRAMVDAQVLTPLNEATLMATPADQTSIMCYQLPGEITRDGRPIIGGLDINATDYAFMGRIYPRPGSGVEHDAYGYEGAAEEHAAMAMAAAGNGAAEAAPDWDAKNDPRPEDIELPA
jgi:hypothetical protein